MVQSKKKRKKRSKRRAKPTPQVKEQRDHRRIVRAVFRNVGFDKVVSVSDRVFTYQGQKSDFDDVFVYENVIVFAEYTTTQPGNIASHLKNKKVIYDLILDDPAQFVEFFETQFPKFDDAREGLINSCFQMY